MFNDLTKPLIKLKTISILFSIFVGMKFYCYSSVNDTLKEQTPKGNFFFMNFNLGQSAYNISQLNVSNNFKTVLDVGLGYQMRVGKELVLSTIIERVQRGGDFISKDTSYPIFTQFDQLSILFTKTGKTLYRRNPDSKTEIKPNFSLGFYNAFIWEQGKADEFQHNYVLEKGVSYSYGKLGLIIEMYFSFFSKNDTKTKGFLAGTRISTDIPGLSYKIKNKPIDIYDKFSSFSIFYTWVF